MHKLEHAILDVFRERPQEQLSTTELVANVLKKEMHHIQELLETPDPKTHKEGKRKKAQLHRKLLYHLGKLVTDELLTITGTQGRGEKCYALALSGDVTIRSGRKQITIHKPQTIETPIDGVEGTIPFQSENWLRKVNAVFLESIRYETLSEAADKIDTIAPYVNDAIGLLRFDTLLGTADPDVFLDRLKRQPCMIVLAVSMPHVKDGKKVIRFCRAYAANKPPNVQIVFNVNPNVLQEQRETLQSVIEQFMEKTIKINLRNSSIHEAPIICGRAGPYTMSESSWHSYKKQRLQCEGVVVCGATIILDLERGKHLHKLARRAAETLFLVGRSRKVRVKGLKHSYMDDMIRCWNHELNKETLFQEIIAAQEVVDDYATTQERVYRACGIPIRCKIRVSSTFGKTGGLSARAYKKVTVHGLNTLQETNYAEYLKRREALSRHFIADRVRVFRHGDGSPEDVLREAAFILNSYALPYVTYDFSELRGDVKLTSFLGGEE